MILGITPRYIQQTFCFHDWNYTDDNRLFPHRTCKKCGRYETQKPFSEKWVLVDPFDCQREERWTPEEK